jgi:3-isopropylmalate dehydratase small subunit
MSVAGKKLDVDLASQTITREDGQKFSFQIDAFRKHCLINGLDDIGLTLQKADKISQFEKKRAEEAPWFDNAAQVCTPA